MLPKNRPPMHPGKLLAKTLADEEMSQTELAKRLDVSYVTINTLVHEKRGMTAELAVKLAKVFDTTPQMWMNLQTNLEIWLAEHGKPARAHG